MAPSFARHSPEIRVVPCSPARQSFTTPLPMEPGAGQLDSDQAFLDLSSRIHHSFPLHRQTTNTTFAKLVHTLYSYLDVADHHSLIQLHSKRDGFILDGENRQFLVNKFTGLRVYERARTNTSPNSSGRTFQASQVLTRSLRRHLLSQINDGCIDMTTTAVSAPGSPPDLSGSRSSKSSSYCSTSQHSSPDGILSDISNFEEIGLDDERDIPTSPSRADRVNVGHKGAATRVTQINTSVNSPIVSPREDVFPKRPVFPSLKGQVRGVVTQSSWDTPPLGKIPRNSRRGFTSPSVPVLPVALSSTQPRTRSISPARGVTTSATSNASITSLRHIPVSPRSSLPIPRRSSWQPNRKSIQELEAEYHDSDDELPDEASLWNVPMSPRPPEERISPMSSHGGSPDGRHGSRSPRPIPLAHARTAPESPPPHVLASQSLPKNRPLPPRTSSLAGTNVAPSPTSPRSRHSLRAIRTKSWSFALAELSEEARVLSEALEYHAENGERAHEEMVQRGHSRRPSQEATSRRSSTIQLPPLQKGNLDFMPISKEKEAILSRTRPSWLPPKDPREEKKHLKEYQQMMAASIEAEKKKEDQLHIQQCQKDDTREALNKIWEEYVSPKRDALDTDDRVRNLWWRGVSPKVRGQVWDRTVGNQLALTPASYDRALARAKEIEARKPDDLTEKEKSMLQWFKDIERDAETAFPELNLFQRNGPLWQGLVDVCEAYVCYRSDVGYLYGVQLISALLLLQLNQPSEVFVLLANCLNRPMPLAFLTNDLGSTGRTYGLAISTLAIKFPRLHTYLFGSHEKGGLNMSGEEIFEPMFRTLFSNGLDLDRLARVWDVWAFEGDRTLVRTAVAILGCLQSQIFGIDGPMDLKRRNIQDMLGWGPYGRTDGYWDLSSAEGQDGFVEEVREAGKLDYTGR